MQERDREERAQKIMVEILCERDREKVDGEQTALAKTGNRMS